MLVLLVSVLVFTLMHIRALFRLTVLEFVSFDSNLLENSLGSRRREREMREEEEGRGRGGERERDR
jgi:hypothetical protein